MKPTKLNPSPLHCATAPIPGSSRLTSQNIKEALDMHKKNGLCRPQQIQPPNHCFQILINGLVLTAASGSHKRRLSCLAWDHSPPPLCEGTQRTEKTFQESQIICLMDQQQPRHCTPSTSPAAGLSCFTTSWVTPHFPATLQKWGYLCPKTEQPVKPDALQYPEL